MTKIGLECARSPASHTRWRRRCRCRTRSASRDHPPGFTLGGSGGGIAYNREEFVEIVQARPRAVAEQRGADRGVADRLEGVRDGGGARPKDNCIIVCSIENLDPMGVHTGDSITVAPAQTLTDKEYQIMRDASIACCARSASTPAAQRAVRDQPADGRMIVIEMNPRVSRSSALASKATGFPIAKIAAKLAVGYTLDELRNDITGGARRRPLRADDRLRRHQDPALRLREVPGADDR
jgi:carbamoyl-phosphate synthase large subunit